MQVTMKRYKVRDLFNAIAEMDGALEQVKDVDGKPAGILRKPYDLAPKAIFALARTRSGIQDEVAAFEKAQQHVLSGLNGNSGLNEKAVAGKGLSELAEADVQVEVSRIDVALLKLDVNRVPGTVLCNLLPMLEGEV